MPDDRRGDTAILPPGTRATLGDGHDGTIDAVGTTGGERYYWLTMDNGTVAMIPGFAVWQAEEA